MTPRQTISIICPVFNEQEAVPVFYRRLAAVMDARSQNDFEVIFTNNRSTDRTLEVIQEIRARDPRVHVLTFSRNFGYQCSVLAGFTHARGDAFVVIDVDCEDPPEMIAQFIEHWDEGYDIVYGQREKRPEPMWVQLSRKLFYRLNRLVADSDIVLDMAEFSLVSAPVRAAMLDNVSTYPFLRTEIGFVGFKRKAVPYDRQARVAGYTHYNVLGMAEFAIGGILSSSTFPLRLAVYASPFLLVLNAVLGAFTLIQASFRAFALLVMTDLVYLMMCSMVLCLYLARTYKNGVGRPNFIVDWKHSSLPQPRVA